MQIVPQTAQSTWQEIKYNEIWILTNRTVKLNNAEMITSKAYVAGGKWKCNSETMQLVSRICDNL